MQLAKQLIVLLTCGLALSGCGNYLGDVTVKGRTGLALSEVGNVVIRVQPCGLAIDLVDISGPMVQNEEPQPNPIHLQARDPHGRSEPFIIDPNNIEPSWEITENNGLPTESDAMIIINSLVWDKNSQTSQVSALISEVMSLKEGEILVGNTGMNSRVIDEDEFLHCR